MPASSMATMFSMVPYLASPVTWCGQIFRRKQTRHSRSPHRLVLHDVGRGDEGGEDDAPLAAIHDVVVVVAEANRAPVPHRGGIGIGGADPKVAGASVAAVGGTVRIEPPLLQQPPWRIALSRHALGIDWQLHDSWRQVGVGFQCSVVGLVREQISDVRRGVVVEAGDEGRDAGVGFDLRGVEVELPAPDEARLLAQIDDLLEEALEDVDAEPLPDAGQAGVVGQRLVEGVAEVPAVGQVEAGGLDELALGADALEEHHQLQLEEDDRVDGGPAPLGVELPRPVADEAQVELGFQVAVEVVDRDEVLQRDGDRLVEAAGFGRAEHRGLRDGASVRAAGRATPRPGAAPVKSLAGCSG